MPLIELSNLAELDEQIFNTWDSVFGTPLVLDHAGRFVETQTAMDSGPGAWVAPDLLERGYNAYYGAPGYYIDAREGVDRVIDDQYIHDMEPPAIGVNPWDHIFGTYGAGDPVQYMERVQARERPVQAGAYSFS